MNLQLRSCIRFIHSHSDGNDGNTYRIKVTKHKDKPNPAFGLPPIGST